MQKLETPTVERAKGSDHMWRWTIPRKGCTPLTGLADTEELAKRMVGELTRPHGPDRVRGPRSPWATDYHDKIA